MKTAMEKGTLALLAVLLVIAILAAILSMARRQGPIPDDRRFSQAVHALVNDILEKENAKQVSRYVINVPSYAWADVDEPTLMSRKDDIARAASTAGDRSLVELLGAVEQEESKGEVVAGPVAPLAGGSTGGVGRTL